MDKPTQEQIKEFWERYGCRIETFTFFLDEGKEMIDLVFPDSSEQRYYEDQLRESIDSNNLLRGG